MSLIDIDIDRSLSVSIGDKKIILIYFVSDLVHFDIYENVPEIVKHGKMVKIFTLRDKIKYNEFFFFF